jgi:hypothetical protein
MVPSRCQATYLTASDHFQISHRFDLIDCLSPLFVLLGCVFVWILNFQEKCGPTSQIPPGTRE